ncbi:hypothetical protein CCR85_13350 [Rhodothalassium salexigens]|uniref:DUF983 domain-containing protein n=1 Tax=Rhodothalassium salexigens TaxID=1086 RepID=UPI001912C1EA|nr:DUF983 domain-containing protein [Rhodothalassium salexigens]MBK5912473.1 hypothetical protein [Rhodothalassium salexigens]
MADPDRPHAPSPGGADPTAGQSRATPAPRPPVPPVSPLRAGLSGRCPACGRGALFDGLLALKPACERCGHDLSQADPGDGPAVFVVLILGILAGGLGLIVEMRAHPPLWVHALILLPVIGGGTVGLLRVIKGLLVCYEYHHDAREARLDREPEP